MGRADDGVPITHWLRAYSLTGGICASSADHPDYGPGFVRAHERAGHTIKRISLDELRDEHDSREAARERTWSTPALSLSAEKPIETSTAVVAVVGEYVRTPRGTGEVISHLRFRSGEVNLLVRYKDGEGMCAPAAARVVARPEPVMQDVIPEPPPQELPLPESVPEVHVEPVLLVTPQAVYVQDGLF